MAGVVEIESQRVESDHGKFGAEGVEFGFGPAAVQANGARNIFGECLAIVAFAVLTLFQLVTLPVEYDASRRAKAQLVSLGILDSDEMPGVNEVLDAAALTYLAAFMTALIQLLSLLSRRN